MHTKDQLLTMDVMQLMSLAESLKVKVSPDDSLETVVDNIISAQTANETTEETTKRKRTRIQSRDIDHIYTVNGAEGENLDAKENQKGKQKPKQQTLFDNQSLRNAKAEVWPDLPEGYSFPLTEEQIMELYPKHPGRRSKAELDAIQQLRDISEKVKAEGNEAAPETPQDEEIEEETEFIPQEDTEENYENQDVDFTTDEVDDNGIWMGDPADGTDFIVINGIPVEDPDAEVPFDYELEDEPEDIPEEKPVPQQEQKAMFDFSNIIEANGVLEIITDGYGFIRSSDYNYLSSPDDIYVSQQQIKKYGLKTGDVIECTVNPPHDNDKFFLLGDIKLVNGRKLSELRDRVSFEHLTPLFPDEKFTLCGDPATTNASVRIVDLFTPIGKGQRALLVAQPKTGKTILMKDIANAIAANHPEAYLMMLLIDERPEEVTDMARTVNAEVIASTFDESAEHHVKIAGIVLEKAKRLVESGHDVVIFLDSITRLARAYNTVSPASGRILTGGVDANALQKPKRFFGAARNIEGGGSLTIIATALIDTGSKMDEVIFEEFKGTGNMELQLDRTLSNKRIFPSVNLVASSTRRDDLLHDEFTLQKMWIVRKYIAEMNSMEAMDTVKTLISRTHNHQEFLMAIND